MRQQQSGNARFIAPSPFEATPVTDTLAYLEGVWRLDRTVLDRATGHRGTFHGAVTFTPLGDGTLHAAERGTLTWEGVPRHAERTLLYRPGFTAGTAAVHFADGRFFHDLDLRRGEFTAEHFCGADTYAGSYTVFGRNGWNVSWAVRGPAKDLLISSDHVRADRPLSDN
ncbi:DUF6314 family protein [Allostreptomyces psammosilenae]|uniref:DUF6314 domain-containing protein n=1 Tax=Allostreptomyces psammosilenae TaxID=1892865 RepID=A0A852ZNR0_9ACTN|nr:DUF6314 family protein [Allostreptomyces psammosilenae]NYI04033.1 hypothetical protein [Allostreptomyces psammosilenae]